MAHATANFAHQEYLFERKHAPRLVVFGAGSVASMAVLGAAKMGMKDIVVWDGDVVESHNTPMSLYAPSDVGRLKVDALQERVHTLTGVMINTHAKYFARGDIRNCMVLAAVDTMKARRAIWRAVRKTDTVPLMFDTRTAATYVEVLTIQPFKKGDILRYERLLFPESEAVRQNCGMHGIIFASMQAAVTVTANIANYCNGNAHPWRVAYRCDTLQQVM